MPRQRHASPRRNPVLPWMGLIVTCSSPVAQFGDPAPPHHTYIAASYVKFLEGAGARVIPILADMPPAEVEKR